MPAFTLSEALNVLQPLGILVLEMVIYAVLVFKFYKFLASRDIITVNLGRYKNTGIRFGRLLTYFLQNVLFFPVIIFFWFAILAVFLGFLGKNQTTDHILLVAIALVSAVRVASYFSEDLSKDLAKMLPFTLLGIYIVDQSYFDISISLKILTGVPDYWQTLVYYLAFIIALEFVLRIIYYIVTFMFEKPRNPPVIPETKK
jgi:hypothetical protein